jgi:hypothetical protein
VSKYTEAVDRGLRGRDAVSTGVCPGCTECQEEHGYDTIEAFEEAWSHGRINSEVFFSWRECGICYSHLGGDREIWHWVDDNNKIRHEYYACTDCVLYLANGDEPENWEG